MTDAAWTRGAERALGVASTSQGAYALLDDGRVLWWDPRTRLAPAVLAAPPAREVHAAMRTVCVVSTSGGVWCRTETPRLPPADLDAAIEDAPLQQVPGLSDVVALAGSAVRFVKADGESQGGPIWYAVQRSGAVQSWETPFSVRVAPAVRAVAGVSQASSVAVGLDHACAVTGAGLRCWHHLVVLAGSDDRGPPPNALERDMGIDDAISGDGTCLRRARHPLTCLAFVDSFAKARARDRRAYLEEYAPGVARMREASGQRCLLHDDAPHECSDVWSSAPPGMPEGAVDVALGLVHVCALMKDRSFQCRLRGPR